MGPYARRVPVEGECRVGVIEALGHLAIWAAMYVVGCAVFAGWLLGSPVGLHTGATIFLITMGTYLLDRVGAWPGLPDRADVVAVPRRVRFLRRVFPGARVLALGVLVVGLVLAAAYGLLVALVVPAAVIGMLVYGHVPGRRRLKDIILVKNLAVALSITALVLVLVLAQGARWSWPALLVTIGAMLLHVLSGAVLCDVDDRHADARRGTRTVPNVLGPGVTWWIADGLSIAGGASILVGAQLGWVTTDRATALAVLPVVATLFLHLARPRHVRNLVDIAFPVAVFLAWVVQNN